MEHSTTQTLLVAALVGAAYLAGSYTPSASAYTTDETRLMNKIAGELSGIRRSLERIEGKMKR